VKNSFLRGHNTEQGQIVKEKGLKLVGKWFSENFSYCSA